MQAWTESDRPGRDTASGAARYHALDGLRGIAALLVAAFHIGQRYAQTTPAGYLAVDLFFALSGFVIAANYASRLQEGLGAARFMALRLVRLYPLYLLGTLIGVTREAFHLGVVYADMHCHNQFTVCVAAAVTMVPVLPDALFPFNGPAWSLLMELVVNGLFALWLYRCGQWSLAALTLVGAVVMLLFVPVDGNLNLGWNWSSAVVGAARATASFSIGCFSIAAGGMCGLASPGGRWLCRCLSPFYSWRRCRHRSGTAMTSSPRWSCCRRC